MLAGIRVVCECAGRFVVKVLLCFLKIGTINIETILAVVKVTIEHL